MSLNDKLLHLFPDAVEGDWKLQSDAQRREGYITQWNRPEPQPTIGRINAVTAQQESAAKKEGRASRRVQFTATEEAIVRWVAGLHSITFNDARRDIKQLIKNN